MGYTVIGTSVKEKDLGVTISADMKVSEHCGVAASKGNQTSERMWFNKPRDKEVKRRSNYFLR